VRGAYSYDGKRTFLFNDLVVFKEGTAVSNAVGKSFGAWDDMH
jgi:hypothetical protein